ncbi:hypothetical protein FO519_000350 [Halicephalobus sp. NKZ332]|nr:hypothetical protein FO519_000350 [Halicephalobus sp. NKZ332]
MKKLKRRLSQAFRSSYHPDTEPSVISGQIVDSFQSIDLNGSSMTRNHVNGKKSYTCGSQHPIKTFGLSDSLSHLADKLAADGVIAEEEACIPPGATGIYRRRGSRNHLYPPSQGNNSFILDRPAVLPQRPISYYGHIPTVCEYPNCEPQVLIRPKSRRTNDMKSKHKSFTEHLVGSLKKSGKPLFGYRSKVLVSNDSSFGVPVAAVARVSKAACSRLVGPY